MSYLKGYNPHYRYTAKEFQKLHADNCLNLQQIIAKVIGSNYALMSETPMPLDNVYSTWGIGLDIHVVRTKIAEICKQLYAKYGKLDVTMTATWLTKDMTL